MVKNLLTASLFLLAAQVGMAQNSYDTALELKTGDNTYEVTTSDQTTTYWKYTAAETTMVKYKALSGGSLPDVQLATDEGYTELNTAYSGTGYRAIDVEKGKTVYFSFTTGKATTVGFTVAGITSPTGLQKGLTQDDPMTIVPGEEQLVGISNSSRYSSATYYATYTPEGDGILVLKPGYVSKLIADGSTVSPEYDSEGNSEYHINVTAGTACDIRFQTYYPLLLTSSFSQPTQGSIEQPFALVEGANKVPAAAGEYYYTYAPAKKGYFTITSDEALTGGYVQIYTSKSNVNYNYPAQTSKTGEFGVRQEVTWTGTTYYVKVVKTTATDAEQTFNFEMADYAQGESEDNPFVIEVPSTNTLPSASGSYYYSVTVPANTNKWLVVKSLMDSQSESTKVYVSPKDSYSSQNGTTIVKYDVTNTAEATYIITWEPDQETEPIKFSVYYDDIKAGDVASTPLTAVLGENTTQGEGVQYYQYTATKTGKLSVTTSGSSVEFPQDASEYASKYETMQNGNEYYIESTEGTTYLIKLSDVKAGDKFTVAEDVFGAGESKATALEVGADGYTSPEGSSTINVWLKYTAQKDGMVDIHCDAEYNWNDQVSYGFESDWENTWSYLSNYTSEGTTYDGSVKMSAGEAVLVHLQMSSLSDPIHVTFTPREYKAGEDITAPLDLVLNETYTIPTASYSAPVWMTVTANGGEIKIQTESSLGGYIYAGKEDAENGQNGTQFYAETEDYSAYYITFQGEKGVTYYIKGTSSWYDQQLTLIKNGSTDGIQGITAEGIDASAPLKVYTLNGQLVSNRLSNLNAGVYIVSKAGKTHKVVVK